MTWEDEDEEMQGEEEEEWYDAPEVRWLGCRRGGLRRGLPLLAADPSAEAAGTSGACRLA